ncbi:hypothetical protein EJ110_NYTH38595 [Nymphaea thermarum]|nr:hypothetical protein EJ110_NYTH38595 [Nymphaea thermarum]
MNAGASNYGDSKKGKKVVAVKELASRYEEQEDVVGRDDEELRSLLPLQKKGSFKGGANGGTESRRKVQWNDKDGDKLAEVREFVPREKPEKPEVLISRSPKKVTFDLQVKTYAEVPSHEEPDFSSEEEIGRVRDRSQYVHPVLNAVENRSQWQALKSKESKNASVIKERKENIPRKQEAISKFSLDPRPEPRVDASLSSWYGLVAKQRTEGDVLEAYASSIEHPQKEAYASTMPQRRFF